MQGDLLVRVAKDKSTGACKSQLLMPKQYHSQILELAHDVLFIGRRPSGWKKPRTECWSGFLDGVYQEIKKLNYALCPKC